MKLSIEKGDLNLPIDFSLEIEQQSALFTESGGTASLPVTIPATAADLEKLDFPTRPARDTRYINLFPARLAAGVFQKKGQLVVQSASEDGITCALALEDSDFYTQFKSKNLRDIFINKELTTYNTVQSWCNYLFNIYRGQYTSSTPFRVIPVAVNYDETTGEYQVNNEPVQPSYSWYDGYVFNLNTAARIIKEGSDQVSVPLGYGIAPFYLMSFFLEDMFSLCGYTVRQNCFRTHPLLSSLLLLHNCSDVLIRVEGSSINCADLVPNKTVAEILDWMLKKFKAQIVVYPTTAMVDIVLLEDILTAGYDKVLTGQLLGKLTYTFSETSRVVLTPGTSLEGAESAAETLEDLKNKYQTVVRLKKGETSPTMGLTLVLATGMYYEVGAGFGNFARRVPGSQGRGGDTSSTMKSKGLIGSNYFKYDRRNSKNSEEIDWDDLTPPMVYVNDMLMPYIGERTHRHTAYKDSERDEEQEIIVVSYVGQCSAPVLYRNTQNRGYYYYGTTQKYDDAGELRQGAYDLTALDMFTLFFSGYNRMLRNNLVKIDGQFNLAIEEILSYQMYKMKLYDGQLLLPLSLKYEVGKQIRCQQASFYLIKDHVDDEEDVPTEMPESQYKWVLNDSLVQAEKTRQQQLHPSQTIYAKYNDDYETGDKTFFIPAPTAAGQRSVDVPRVVDFLYYRDNSSSHSGSSARPDPVVVSIQTINVWFEAAAIN